MSVVADILENLHKRDAIIRDAVDHPKMRRGVVWCLRCGTSQRVDPAKCMRDGWPVCCKGYTMTIDSPEERGREAA